MSFRLYRFCLRILTLAILLLLNAWPAAAGGQQLQLASITRPAAEPGTYTEPWIQIFAGSTPFHLILVEKERQRLQVLQYDGELRTVAEYFSATGMNSGKKEVSGDARTPEGIYFITKKFEDNKITIFGKLAFHLDYPNYFDRDAGLNGDGIYIHGTNKNLKGNSTNGCITLRNEDLDEMVEYLRTDATPVIIVQNRKALQSGRFRVTDLKAENLKGLLLPGNLPPDKAKTDYLYALDDGRQTVAVGRFTYDQGDGAPVNGYGRGYISLSPEKAWLASEKVWLAQSLSGAPDDETRGKATAGKGAEQKKTRLVSAAYPQDEKQLNDFIEKWRRAWQSKDISTYISCYEKNFRKDRMNRDGWRSYKERLNRKYKNISVSVSDIKVDWGREGAKVVFREVYKSDLFYANGHKMLILTHDPKLGWGIQQEVWLN